MEIYEYSFEQLEESSELFSQDLVHDGWVLFHATTSIAEADIDRSGLKVCCSGQVIATFSAKRDSDALAGAINCKPCPTARHSRNCVQIRPENGVESASPLDLS